MNEYLILLYYISCCQKGCNASCCKGRIGCREICECPPPCPQRECRQNTCCEPCECCCDPREFFGVGSQIFGLETVRPIQPPPCPPQKPQECCHQVPPPRERRRDRDTCGYYLRYNPRYRHF